MEKGIKESQFIAEESERRYDETNKRVEVFESDLERTYDRADSGEAYAYLFFFIFTVKCRTMSHPLCPLMSADIAGHPVTSRDKSYLRGVLGRLLNENLGQVGNAQNNY